MDLADPRNFRRTVAGASMVAVAVLVVAQELLHPRSETEAAAWLEAVAGSRGGQYWSHLLLLFAVVFAIPAFLGLVHLARARPALGHVALVAFVAGVVPLSTVLGIEFAVWQMARPGADRAEMVALLEALQESGGFVPVFAGVGLFAVSWVLVGIALYAAHAVRAWEALLVAVPLPANFGVELSGGPKAIQVVLGVAFAVGLVSIGARVLRQTDDEWAPAVTPKESPLTAPA